MPDPDLPNPDLPNPPRDAVLITRPEPGAGETAVRVAALGLTPVVAPLLEVRSLPATLPPSGQLQAILVASGNALPSLPAAYHHLPLLAVGDATAARAGTAGFATVHSAGADAAALAALAARLCDPAGSPLLLAAGRGQSQALAAALRASGFGVIRRAVYESLPVTRLPDEARVALSGGRLRAVLFFSAETARQFVRVLSRAGLRDRVAGIDGCAIGRPSALAIEGLPWRRILCAAQPTQDAMLALLS